MNEQEDTTKEVHTYDDLYVGRFFKAAHMKGRRVTLTIANVWTEELQGEREKKRKPILAFRETERQLVLPPINGVCLKAMFGANVKEWFGKRVTFWPTDTLMPMPTAKGPDRFCVRVWGSPDIDKPVSAVFTPPKRRAIRMTMQPTGRAIAKPQRAADHDPDTGEVTTDVVDLPEYTEDGVLIPAETAKEGDR